MSLIFFDWCDCGYEWFGWPVMRGVAPGFGIHVTVGLKACILPVVLAPISDIPGAYDSR
ncbi:hypothetical protein [Brevibacterium sp. 239c]|uniref:hypothetical protein n=1 Tax=Brevibacterium sp. 239c TaxID=1965356 RepID=UPI0015E0CD3C|nr:hypothetical protein [Brevibacterium sp. 239c]